MSSKYHLVAYFDICMTLKEQEYIYIYIYIYIYYNLGFKQTNFISPNLYSPLLVLGRFFAS
jgi:hypothetical protein